jgi:uncharacterized protein YqkB
MHIVNGMADRIISALAPKITAEARLSCTPHQYYSDAGCGCTSSGFQKLKICSVSSSCTVSCGGCDYYETVAC